MLSFKSRVFSSQRGSATTAVVLITITVVIIIGGLALMNRDKPPTSPAPQAASQLDTRAFYIAQTALDRSVKALAANPWWREGFSQVPFEDGKYDVKIYDQSDGDGRRTDIPPNYVRIVASSEIDGVKKQVEAVWVNAMSAFHNAYTAGDRLELDNHDSASRIVVGNIHSNAWEGGGLYIGRGTVVYGDVTSVGKVDLGAEDTSSWAMIYGDVWGSHINLASTAEIRKYENLSERAEGVDLNGNGDTADMGLSTDPIGVAGANAVTSGGRSLRDGDMDVGIGGGAVRVVVGGPSVGAIVDPRPDFIAYYELVAGSSAYPPPADHVTTPISGDGDGHYFASSDDLLSWLDHQEQSPVFCWRCAGDGRVDPKNGTECPTCAGMGRDVAIEVTGVFYIDDAVLDLGSLGANLVLHGTIVVAEGDPYSWPARSVSVPGGDEKIEHFPRNGQFVLNGQNRMHFTQTHRSHVEGGGYFWRNRTVFGGEDAQTIAIPEPDKGDRMRDFPAILAATKIVIEPRAVGFAHHPGDIGDERLTVMQGVLFAEDEVRLHGRGGWRGETLVFEEDLQRGDDESLDEPVLNIDLNGDGDMFDRVELSGITTVPVVPVSRGKYSVDINNDGMLGKITLGTDYIRFFNDNGYVCPVLIYLEGLVLGQYIHSCDQTFVVFDPLIAAGGLPFGFDVSFGLATYQGLVSWWERRSP
jgi:hypothetical protein